MLRNKGILNYIKYNLKKNLDILNKEILVTITNYHYFSNTNPEISNESITTGKSRASLSATFINLKKLVNLIENLSDKLNVLYKDLEELIENAKKIQNNNYHINIDILQNIFYVKKRLSENAELLHFLQKKMNYLLDSYPVYYPTLSFYRTKQEVKTYEWLKRISSSFLQSAIANNLPNAKISTIDSSNVVINWSANDENYFLPIGLNNENEPIILFDGSYYLINKQSLWIILFHESLHFFLNYIFHYYNNENPSEHYDNFYKKYHKLKQNAMETIYEGRKSGLVKIDLGKIENLFDEIMCDSILTNLYKEKYYNPLLSELICSPTKNIEMSLLEPLHNHYWTRLYVAAHFLKTNEKQETLNFLETYQNTLVEKGSNAFFDQVISDKKIAKILLEYAEYISNKVFKFNNNSEHIDNVTQFYLKSVGKISNNCKSFNYTDDFSFKEGRIVSGILSLCDYFDKNAINDIIDKKSNFEFLENANLVKITFIKNRFDSLNNYSAKNRWNLFKRMFKEKFNNIFGDHKFYFSFNPYTYVAINIIEDEHNHKQNKISEKCSKPPHFFQQTLIGHEILQDENNSEILESDLIIISQFTFNRKLIYDKECLKNPKNNLKDMYKNILEELYFREFDNLCSRKKFISSYKVIQTSTWADFIVIIGLKCGKTSNSFDIADKIKIYKDAIHKNRYIERSTSDFLFCDKNNLEFNLTLPVIYLKKSVVAIRGEITTDIYNKIQNCLYDNKGSWNYKNKYKLSYGVGIYDYILIPDVSDSKKNKITTNELFNGIIANLYNTNLFTDIQIRHLTDTENNKDNSFY